MTSSALRAPQSGGEVEELRARLQEAQETLDAIRSGAVDAIVVEGPKGRQVFTLQGAERPYRVLAETMNEGAASLERNGTILFCNRRLGEILEVPQAQLLGTQIICYVREEQRGAFGLLLAAAATAPRRGEFECATVRGNTTVLFSLSPLGLDGGEGICLVATDLREQKKLERALEDFAAQLSRSNEELSQFAYLVSHDLQEPLRHIVGFGDMLQEHSANMSPEAADCAARMQKGARRMSQLIEGLLQYSRAFGREELPQAVDLARITAEVMLDLHQEIQQCQACITVEALPRVYAVPSHMQQLLRNLLSNALKFQAPNARPEIRIGSRPVSEAGWEISVRDNGIGFDQSAQGRIFRPFQRLHNSNYPGCGMGLAICRRIVNSYGGTIRGASEPSQGSAFYFTVPAARVGDGVENGFGD
ncbi:MAG TPA: ATP-binding protein [Terriglobales bacterium]|nr:ATP-binding protein [Terriglobales bacterium]